MIAGILSVGTDLESRRQKRLLAQLVDEDTELISLYYGDRMYLEEDAEHFAGEIDRDCIRM